MKKRFVMIGLAAATAILGSLVLLQAEENKGKPPSPDLPEAVLKSVQKIYPGSEILATNRDESDDRVRYDAKIKTPPDGKIRDLVVAEDGLILAIDEPISQGDLPKAVLKALEKALPKNEIRETGKRTEIRVTYSLKVVSRGKEYEVEISHGGRVKKIEKRGESK